jgi:NRPS condensation-like uncharacterized protein
MGLELKFGNTGIKISYGTGKKGFYKSNNSFKRKLFKQDVILFKKIFKNACLDKINNYREQNKELREQTATQAVNCQKAGDEPYIMPANGHDIYNYVARYGLGNYQIQAVMKLDGKIDYNKLVKAVRLSVDEEPVFGCRFIESEPPYWKRLDNIDQTEFCSFEETSDPDEVVQRFLESPLDMDRDPMVKVKLIRSEPDDTICIKINHACCDGTGTKEYIQLISKIYSFIEDDSNIFIPKPKKRSRVDQDRLFSGMGISDPIAEWVPGSEITRATWPFPWKQAPQSEENRMMVRRCSREQLDRIKNYSKYRGVTINDLVLTAYYRAMTKMEKPSYCGNMEISVTIDLRRYLPDNKTDAIRNFSGSEITSIDLMPDETFDETLSRIAPVMKKIKENRGGLQSAIGLERVEKMALCETLAYYKNVSQWSYCCSNKCAPVLSNLGIIADSLIKFGKVDVKDLYIVPPVVRPPGLLLMVCTYNGIMTLSAGFYENTVRREDIEKLLDGIFDELEYGCIR